MNSSYSYYKLVIIISLLFSQITHPMQSNSLSTQDKVTFCIMIPAFFATAYGFYKFLDWLNPKQTNLEKTSSSNQIIGNVITAKNINLKQSGAPDTENPSLLISTLQGKYSVKQTGGFRVNHNQTKSLNELSISFSTLVLTKIIAQGMSQIHLHQASSVREQKMTLTSANNDLKFCIDIQDGILNYTCSKNSSSTKPLLQVWVHNKDTIQLQLKDSIEVVK